MAHHCIRCGINVPDGASFCPNCGTQIDSEQTYVAPRQSASQYAPKSDSTRYLFIALAVLLALAIIGGGGYLIHSSKQKEKKELMEAQAAANAAAAKAEKAQKEAEALRRERENAKRQADAAEARRETGAFNFKGSVAGQSVTMHLDVDHSGYATGWYYYNKYGSKRKLYLNGNYSGGGFYLDEYDDYGQQTGYFSGSYHGRSVSGSMTNYKGNTYSFHLKR